ncbi:hypothetical protein PYCCODRAFT_1478819 [Trametes coccinea BRFM310]|uniref:F-box domain-containing protein n=1 Tax=Trametes coccinea (strain BRFM310) TaxID=1353009 RepID=A0A1Y2IIV2_TRAC3|nr:hypothetical protein PYCCODRAFT_1478819 [Trametes coccinea BRFM310]
MANVDFSRCLNCHASLDPFAGLPPADVAAAAGLDDSAGSALQLAIKTRIDALAECIRTLNERYNAASLIYRRLPPEILLQIFAHVRPSRRRDIRLAHVSRAWRSLLLDCPFWADMLRFVVPSRKRPRPTSWFLTFLQRAARNLFSMKLPLFSSVVLDAVGPYLSKVTKLDVVIPPAEVVSLFQMLQYGLPFLQSLSIQHLTYGTRTDVDPVHLESSLRSAHFTFDHLLSLRTLLVASWFFYPGMNLPGLRQLHVIDCQCGSHVCASMSDPAKTLAFLRNCPRLELLELYDYRTAQPTDKSLDAVALNQLQDLSIHTNSADAASHHLRSFAYPESVVIRVSTIGARTNSHGERHFPVALLHNPAVQDADEVEIHCSQNRIMLSHSTRGVLRMELSADHNLCSGLEPEGSADCFRDLLELLATTTRSTTTLRIYETSGYVRQVFFREPQIQIKMLLALFPSLTSLTLHHLAPTTYLRALEPLLNGEMLCSYISALNIIWREPESTAAIRESCEVMKAVCTKRSAAGSVLDVLDFTCASMRRFQPRMREEDQKDDVKEYLERFAVDLVGAVKQVCVQTPDGYGADMILREASEIFTQAW